MQPFGFAMSSTGGRAALCLAVLLDACVVAVATGAWSVGYGHGLAAPLAAWGAAGVACAAALAVAVALAYASLRRTFIGGVRRMIDRELEVERLVATFRTLRSPPELLGDDLPSGRSCALHDPASVPVARRLAAPALSRVAVRA
jgi:hypothetical protein